MFRGEYIVNNSNSTINIGYMSINCLQYTYTKENRIIQ